MDGNWNPKRRPGAKASRRSRLRRGLALGAAALALALPASAGATTVAAKSAGSFVDSIGVNTHFSYTDTPYAQQFETVKQRLDELGVKHIREGLMLNRPDQYQNLDELASIGVHSTLILGEPELGTGGLEELISTLKTSVRGSVEAVEGPNEYDTRGGAGWAPALTSYQQQLYSSVKADPALAALPVIGPSIVQKRNQEALGDISGSLDYGNVHSYPQGGAPEENISSYLSRGAINSGPKPIMATETGYHNAMGWTGEQAPVSEAAAATYMPRLFLEYFNRGIARTFSYELLDQGTDPNDRESNWGLLRNDLSPKPAFTSLQNMISILSDSGVGFSPESLDYTAGGDLGGLHQVLLQKSDGSFYLALWRADSVSSSGSSGVASPVKLEFDRGIESVERFEPGVSAGPVGSLAASGGNVTVPVGAQVTILQLHLGGPAGRIHLWVSRRSVQAGGLIAVGGRIPGFSAGHSRSVAIQRYLRGSKSWQTVGHGHAGAGGKFKKMLRVRRRFGTVSRLRVIGAAAQPSKPVKLRIRGSKQSPRALPVVGEIAAAESLGASQPG